MAGTDSAPKSGAQAKQTGKLITHRLSLASQCSGKAEAAALAEASKMFQSTQINLFTKQTATSVIGRANIANSLSNGAISGS